MSVVPVAIVQRLHLTFILKNVCAPNKSTRGGVTRALSRCCAEICLLPKSYFGWRNKNSLFSRHAHASSGDLQAPHSVTAPNLKLVLEKDKSGLS